MNALDRDLDSLRAAMRAATIPDETGVLARLIRTAALSPERRAEISADAARLVRAVRASGSPGLMQSFLAEYGLSTREGVALMCLAEALLRVPDAETIDALIEDKIAPSDWGRHLGRSSSSLVNASTWALMLTGRVLEEDGSGLAGVMRGAVKRLGEPVIRTAVAQAMREMGRQFVLGQDIAEAMRRAEEAEGEGYTYSYDMLGEAARTDADARAYTLAYARAISAIAPRCTSADVRENPGISVKLSALSPRYEFAQAGRVARELVPRAKALAQLAAAANMGFNIDAEEQDRLDLSLDVIEAVIAEPALAGWEGFGVVVQAYGPRAVHIVEWLAALARRHDRRIMLRLVKGAYWDAEIKRAQVLGLEGFPVFTRKLSTDVSYLACARVLLDHADRIYSQFATHNAHTVAAVRRMAEEAASVTPRGLGPAYEFQKLHGMGDALYAEAMKAAGMRCRIYAPVGAHRDLLAYLVRRLLENGANSSFVNQIVDESISPEEIARDPLAEAEALVAPGGGGAAHPRILPAPALWGPSRRNAKGWDLTDPLVTDALADARENWRSHHWQAAPMLAAGEGSGTEEPVTNPADPGETVGTVRMADPAAVEAALAAAGEGFADWSARDTAARAGALRRAADLYEAHAPELFALCAREAGKTLPDAVAELREAVDFLRFYAAEAERLAAAGGGDQPGAARGAVVCISPWNFPLAIFTGQIAAALAAGNAVLAKPAEQTPLIAARAVALLHAAGMAPAALQLLPGAGASVGAALVADPRVAGVAFTGSTATAKRIDRAMAAALPSDAMLVAETGGLNAMIVDSTALPEQAVRDILISAFQSAGQRCSALRILYVQEDVAPRLLEMLQGAMDTLRLGDPWSLSTDVGPVIDAAAEAGIAEHVEAAAAAGRLVHRLAHPGGPGRFVPPALIAVDGIADLEREVFGPVLHVARFAADALDRVIAEINAAGYGLTFGLHSRIDDRVQSVVERIRAGNAYVNRNQIGAIVGSQPFGGEGLSGTGPKAGGPAYLPRFLRPEGPGSMPAAAAALAPALAAEAVGAALAGLSVPDRGAEMAVSLPGPTGESNRLSTAPRGRVLCLGPGAEALRQQARRAGEAGNAVLALSPEAERAGLAPGPALAVLAGRLAPEALTALEGVDAVASDAPEAERAALRRALAARAGPILPLLSAAEPAERYALERHVCVDTTAAGGNASLLAEAGDRPPAAATG